MRTAVKPAVANFAADFIHQEFSWQSCFVIFRFLAIKASQFCINCFFFVFYVVLCLLFFLTFWGTLPCGSHLLNYVSPKHRKCKAKCDVVCQISWKNLNVKLVKNKNLLWKVDYATMNVVFVWKLYLMIKLKKNRPSHSHGFECRHITIVKCIYVILF